MLVSSLLPCGFQDGTQDIRFASKCLYPLSYLTDPSEDFFFFKYESIQENLEICTCVSNRNRRPLLFPTTLMLLAGGAFLPSWRGPEALLECPKFIP